MSSPTMEQLVEALTTVNAHAFEALQESISRINNRLDGLEETSRATRDSVIAINFTQLQADLTELKARVQVLETESLMRKGAQSLLNKVPTIMGWLAAVIMAALLWFAIQFNEAQVHGTPTPSGTL